MLQVRYCQHVKTQEQATFVQLEDIKTTDVDGHIHSISFKFHMTSRPRYIKLNFDILKGAIILQEIVFITVLFPKTNPKSIESNSPTSDITLYLSLAAWRIL